MNNCVACEAFPRHRGAHYTARDVTTLLFSQRVRSLGRTRWMPLPGCFTAAGRQILVSTHLSEDPDARSVGGIWLLEEKGPLMEDTGPPEPERPAASFVPSLQQTPIPPRPPAAAEAEVAVAEIEPEPPAPASTPVPSESEPKTVAVGTAPAEPEPENLVALPKEEERHMAQGTRGYLSWAINGLDVDIRALPGSGPSPSVEQLKAALKSFRAEDSVMARLTETLTDNEAWITLSAPPGQQGTLLISTGQIVDLLVQGGVYDEVLLAHV